jgi:hypothetical protein
MLLSEESRSDRSYPQMAADGRRWKTGRRETGCFLEDILCELGEETNAGAPAPLRRSSDRYLPPSAAIGGLKIFSEIEVKGGVDRHVG